MANVPAVVIQDAKRKARELENFEYRSSNTRPRTDGSDDTNGEDEHAVAEENAAALTWMHRFRRLPAALVSPEHKHNDEVRRRAIMQSLEPTSLL
jgi:hypothetical protein